MYRSKMYRIIEVERIRTTEHIADDPSEQAERDEHIDLMEAALTKVPPPQREVIIMRLQGGMKFREIAHFQNVSINTVQGRYRYGLEKLRSVFNGEMKQ